jgi:Mrp family chromosome partitioning ATPase
MKALRQFAGRYLSAERPHEAVLGVASARHGEGRTTVALGLARSLAEIFSKVVLVEMEDDRGGPTLSQELGLSLHAGVGEYLKGDASLEDILRETGRENLKLVAAGRRAYPESRLESTGRMRTMLDSLREEFDVVVVDLPPLLENEQAPALMSQLDGVVLVVRAGRTMSEDVALTADLCGPVPVRGVLLNHLKYRTPRWLASLVKS